MGLYDRDYMHADRGSRRAAATSSRWDRLRFLLWRIRQRLWRRRRAVKR